MEKRLLTKEEAISLLNKKGKYIHTFMQAGMALLGADHSRESILRDIETAETLEIGGEQCKSIGHGLVINNRLFVEANRERVNELDN